MALQATQEAKGKLGMERTGRPPAPSPFSSSADTGVSRWTPKPHHMSILLYCNVINAHHCSVAFDWYAHSQHAEHVQFLGGMNDLVHPERTSEHHAHKHFDQSEVLSFLPSCLAREQGWLALHLATKHQDTPADSVS